jgi:hypothetical protein
MISYLGMIEKNDTSINNIKSFSVSSIYLVVWKTKK